MESTCDIDVSVFVSLWYGIYSHTVGFFFCRFPFLLVVSWVGCPSLCFRRVTHCFLHVSDRPPPPPLHHHHHHHHHGPGSLNNFNSKQHHHQQSVAVVKGPARLKISIFSTSAQQKLFILFYFVHLFFYSLVSCIFVIIFVRWLDG